MSDSDRRVVLRFVIIIVMALGVSYLDAGSAVVNRGVVLAQAHSAPQTTIGEALAEAGGLVLFAGYIGVQVWEYLRGSSGS